MKQFFLIAVDLDSPDARVPLHQRVEATRQKLQLAAGAGAQVETATDKLSAIDRINKLDHE